MIATSVHPEHLEASRAWAGRYQLTTRLALQDQRDCTPCPFCSGEHLMDVAYRFPVRQYNGAWNLPFTATCRGGRCPGYSSGLAISQDWTLVYADGLGWRPIAGSVDIFGREADRAPGHAWVHGVNRCDRCGEALSDECQGPCCIAEVIDDHGSRLIVHADSCVHPTDQEA